ncbi:MAG: hypothetical protein M1268_03885 [Patescibacteria group bacterium]|nr:hypothetical protein [Patescibacteria group bacterium]
MKKRISILIFCLLEIGVSYFIFITPSFSASCAGVPISGNYTVSTSCTFAGNIDGVDNGSGTTNNAVLIIGTGATLTVNNLQTIGWGSMVKQGTGSVVRTAGGTLKKMPIWMLDNDTDGYVGSTTQNIQATQPSGYRRRNLMTNITTTDCNDNVAAIYQNLSCTNSTLTNVTYAASQQTFAVPAGVTNLTVTAYGGQGGIAGGTYGGKGAAVTANIVVTAGETLYVFTGGAGSSGQTTNAGGYNGGGVSGSYGGSGGGGTDIRRGGNALNQRIVIAGGGGGKGDAGVSSVSGGPGGGNGTAGTDGGGGGGGAGVTTTGGALGSKQSNCTNTTNATAGTGWNSGNGSGNGGNGSLYSGGTSNCLLGGGGGGGYAGGGGGGQGGLSGGGGGGGASSYVVAGSGGVSYTSGNNSGNGWAQFNVTTTSTKCCPATCTAACQ